MDRRNFLKAAAPAAAASILAAPAVQAAAPSTPDTAGIDAALRAFGEGLPGATSYALLAEHPSGNWRRHKDGNRPLFVGSAIKTFILAQYLRDVETGRLSEDTMVTVNNEVRSVSSSVFVEMNGRTPARSALEAMIAHSDNTATDIAMKAVGVNRVRRLISEIGLPTVQIPTSTRMLFSYLGGAPRGDDVGWQGMKRILRGQLYGPARSPMNDVETMKGSALDFVDYYRRALKGRFFEDPASLVEFQRISSQATALWRMVPQGHAAYGKGGSIEWDNFNAISVPGQMLLGDVPVTFCFTVNWNGAPDTFPVVAGQFTQLSARVLERCERTFG